MTNIDAIQDGITDIENSFKKIGMIDGVILNESEIKKVNKILYYRNFCNSNNGKTKPIMVTYDIMDTPILERADDKIRDRLKSARIDIYTSYSFEHQKLIDFLEKIENEFSKEWEVILLNKDYSDEDKIYSLNYEINRR